MSVKILNKDNFNNEINGKMVLVDFFAKWCGPCRMISPIVEELSNEINYVSFCKVDVDESGEIANTFGVLSIPTLLLFKEGKLISKKVGFQSKDELYRLLYGGYANPDEFGKRPLSKFIKDIYQNTKEVLDGFDIFSDIDT